MVADLRERESNPQCSSDHVYFGMYGVYVLYQVGGVYGAFPPVCFGEILPICL